MMLSEKLVENQNSHSCLGSLTTRTKMDQSFSASNNEVSTINFSSGSVGLKNVEISGNIGMRTLETTENNIQNIFNAGMI